MNKQNFYNIIDLGKSKIRLSIFDTYQNNIFSESYETENKDIFLNNICQITDLIKKAEKKISSHIEDLLLILDSSKLLTIDISIDKSYENNLKIEDVYNSIKLEVMQLINSNYLDYEILHLILDYCIIDKKSYSYLPIQKRINNIKLNFKIISFPKKIINEIKETFKQKNLNVINIFCSSYTKSLHYLKNLKKNKHFFLDIGFARTSLVIFENKKFKSINSVPIGSFHITSDISKVFDINYNDAEKIKKSFNQTETEFSYKEKDLSKNLSMKEIIDKNISINTLKKVILYRVQEIIDLSFKQSSLSTYISNYESIDIFLIGDGSILFNNNSFYLENNFDFNSINFYKETDLDICKSGVSYFLKNYEMPKKPIKKSGIFERFFNFFAK